jgi:hypothetical protein
MKGVQGNQNEDYRDEQGRTSSRPLDPSGSQADQRDKSGDLLSAKIEEMLRANCGSWRAAAREATIWRICQFILGMAAGIAGVLVGYLLYVLHPSTSITGVVARSPLLIFIEGLAYFLLRQSRVDREDAKQFTTEANYEARILVQYFLFRKYRKQETLIEFMKILSTHSKTGVASLKHQGEQPKKRNVSEDRTGDPNERIQ